MYSNTHVNKNYLNDPPANSSAESDIELSREAAHGQASARNSVNEMAHPIITYQTAKFCKRFCNENKYNYVCTLPGTQGKTPAEAVYCEWGNASYAWMLDDLTGPSRLKSFEGRDGSSLRNYFFHIANSLPFYERWKDWRFGRRVHVPLYIQDIGPHAARVFLAMRNGDDIKLIAQNLAKSEDETDRTAQHIIAALTKRKRLHLLDPPSTLSLTGLGKSEENDHSQTDIAWTDLAAEQLDESLHLKKAWIQLTEVEQFVLEAMVIEEQDANDVLQALKKLNIQLSEKVPANQTDRQQLYYFRRKTLARLAGLLGIS